MENGSLPDKSPTHTSQGTQSDRVAKSLGVGVGVKGRSS